MSVLDYAPMLRSRDLEETRAYLAAKEIDFRVLGGPNSSAIPDVRLNGVYLADTWLGYIEYGAHAEVRLSPQSSVWLARGDDRAGQPAHCTAGDYWIHVPLRGRLVAEAEGNLIECDRSRGLVVSPCETQMLRADVDNARLSVSLRGESLERQLAALLGGPPSKPLRFEPGLDIAQGHGERLAGVLYWAATELHGAAAHANRLVAGSLEQFVLAWLLLSHPSNYTACIRKSDRTVAPRDIRRARDYIHSHLEQAITLADLVAIAEVPGRTLLKHFRDVCGVSPMRYLRDLRLQRAREELASGRAEKVVTTALRWGFAHAGRFAIEYRKRFGESPSATLARSRG